jgi:hypothetical protein
MAERAGVPTNEASNSPSDPAAGADRERRRLLGGLSATPFLTTLVSPPAFGQQRCTAPSSFASIPTSHHEPPQACLGRPPAYWKDAKRLDQWPAPYQATTRFETVFSLSPYQSATTLLRVLETDGGPPDDVARHIVATLLNVAKRWVPVLTIVSVQGIWRRYMQTGGGAAGYFEPTAGIKWFHDDIVVYLRSTMPV